MSCTAHIKQKDYDAEDFNLEMTKMYNYYVDGIMPIPVTTSEVAKPSYTPGWSEPSIRLTNILVDGDYITGRYVKYFLEISAGYDAQQLQVCYQ